VAEKTMGIIAASVNHAATTRPDLIWAWVTLVLSSSVVIGYAAIAFNWYFQIKVASPQARAALIRLFLISLGCSACGAAFYATDVVWGYLRLCDIVIAGLGVYTWSFLLRMRGLSLVDHRLAQMDELEERAERYREIAELLPHMVWTATADGCVDFSNQRWFDYAGDSRPWLDAVHTDDRDRLSQWWRIALQTAQPVTVEARLVGARGVCRTFLISATPIIHAGAVKWLGACADIEDQKLLAAEREKQAKQKSFLLSALSHDLRTPLNAVALHAELLRSCVKDDEVIQSATAITQNAIAAGELINRLLDFSKVGSMERNVLQSMSLAATLRQLHLRFVPLAEKSGLYLRLELDTDAELQTDRHKLERIIGNLIDNAIKYTKGGGITLATVIADGAITIQVRDTGIGVPQDKAPNLFDEFYQVGNDERDRRKGFGLGLAICRSLAHQIGGEVRLASSGPEGSCFELVLGNGTNDGAACLIEEIHHKDQFSSSRARSLPA
jgi:PAS domain S-box-containing protein